MSRPFSDDELKCARLTTEPFDTSGIKDFQEKYEADEEENNKATIRRFLDTIDELKEHNSSLLVDQEFHEMEVANLKIELGVCKEALIKQGKGGGAE